MDLIEKMNQTANVNKRKRARSLSLLDQQITNSNQQINQIILVNQIKKYLNQIIF